MKTISAQIPDAELSALVAEHIDGWNKQPDAGPYLPAWCKTDETGTTCVTPHGLPLFSTSADAVLPLMEKYEFVKSSRWAGPKWLVSVSNDGNGHNYKWAGYDESFSRACCLALLASRGFTITP